MDRTVLIVVGIVAALLVIALVAGIGGYMLFFSEPAPTELSDADDALTAAEDHFEDGDLEAAEKSLLEAKGLMEGLDSEDATELQERIDELEDKIAVDTIFDEDSGVTPPGMPA